MGGDCLNYGCIPSKALIKSAKQASQIRHAANYGRLIDPWTVEVKQNNGGTQRLTSRSIIIAAGAKPIIPPITGIDEVGYLTTDTLWHAFAKLEKIPQRIVVLGGGPIGCELAQCFARLGAEINLVEQGSHLLSKEDEDVSSLAKISLQESGVTVLTSHTTLRFEFDGDRKFIITEHQGKENSMEFDSLLCVVGPYQFTHVAAHQAWYAAVNALFGQLRRFKVDHQAINGSWQG